MIECMAEFVLGGRMSADKTRRAEEKRGSTKKGVEDTDTRFVSVTPSARDREYLL